MNLVADAGVEAQIVARLRQDNHSVLYVAEIAPRMMDDAILAEANQRKALLITVDKDFGELVFRQRRIHAGVILIRLAGLSNESKAEVVAATLGARGGEMPSSFTVISPGGVRIRRNVFPPL